MTRSFTASKSPQKSDQKSEKLILVIDDEDELLTHIEAVLSDANYVVICASTAEQGVQVVEEFKIHGAIIDVFMRGKGGLWAIEKIKGLRPDVPILAMSDDWQGMKASEVGFAAQSVGAIDVIEKPFDIDDLVQRVSSLVGQNVAI